ncbi:NAD-dependent epimerase/dehydratase family protein [Dickeya undicola]|uniref:NAD-dependent epimerase/dehydratase family protein n=1 Tax=Dickeya undicola TaxID=1577887 RepID=UPI003F240179
MLDIDKTKPVLVTGATGYVAGWLVKRLLEEGVTVHAAVRDPNDVRKTGHLNDMATGQPGTLRFFKADLLEPGSYAQAMKGCGIVFHTASPFKLETFGGESALVTAATE